MKTNVHVFKVDFKPKKVLLISDAHWDNPKCDRSLLKKHLDEALALDCDVLLNGDTFCLMQGAYDPRKNKADIRPEHNKSNYLDAVVLDAIDWFSPYANIIKVVGYGNHECYHKDTEVLTKNGWVKITEVTTEMDVYAFDDKHIYSEKPNAVVSKNIEQMVMLEGTYSKQYVSAKHAVVLNDMQKINAIDVEGLRDLDLPNGRYEKEVSTPSLACSYLVELITAIVCDATIVNEKKYNHNSTKKRIQFKLSKPSKIDYIKKLLDSLSIKYTFSECKKSATNILQPYYIRIYSDDARMIFNVLKDIKQIPSYFANLKGAEFLSMLNALSNTDGYYKDDTLYWTTTSKHDIDVVQMACVLNGWNMSFTTKENASGFKENAKVQYKASIRKNIAKNRKVLKFVEDAPQTVYCLNMPSGNFITRFGGKVAFSGNTNILKRQETDVIERFVFGLNAKNNTNVHVGGYGGWIVYNFSRNCKGAGSINFKIKYFHGSGGGGPVTKGTIQFNRMATMVEGADMIWMGHVHEDHELTYTVERLNANNKVYLRDILMVRTATYKEEYNEGKYGWHVERGAPPKPMGGRWLEIHPTRSQKTGDMEINVSAFTYKTK